MQEHLSHKARTEARACTCPSDTHTHHNAHIATMPNKILVHAKSMLVHGTTYMWSFLMDWWHGFVSGYPGSSDEMVGMNR